MTKDQLLQHLRECRLLERTPHLVMLEGYGCCECFSEPLGRVTVTYDTRSGGRY